MLKFNCEEEEQIKGQTFILRQLTLIGKPFLRVQFF